LILNDPHNRDEPNPVRHESCAVNHLHFEILKGVPVKATITEGNANGKEVLAENLEAGRIYVLDRGYAKYGLLQKILDGHSSFVCRI